MKSVLISIQQKWCELIASGKKTVEVRKTRPSCEVPFKCYIYCTQGKFKDLGVIGNEIYQKRMKVIGEFVCDKIVKFPHDPYDPAFSETADLSCVGIDGLSEYLGHKDYGYGWHITDLVVYDEPRELSEFKRVCDGNCQSCQYAIWQTNGWAYEPYIVDCKPIKRPPQSWCYVERSENGKS